MGISEACNHEMVSEVVPEFFTREMGIPLVVTNCVQFKRCAVCGEETHSIPFPERLIAAAAVSRVKISDKLSGNEIRFLRKALGASAKDFAESLEVAPETLSRWENDKAPMNPMVEKMLRITVGVRLGKQAPAIDFRAEDILSMSIKAIRELGAEITLSFKLVSFKTAELPTTEAYDEQKKAA